MLSGAKSKSQANDVYDSSWDLDLQTSDGVENAVQRQPSVRLASGSSAFVINFQAYFIDFDVDFSEVRHPTEARCAVASTLLHAPGVLRV
jgi:hypothetical protein